MKILNFGSCNIDYVYNLDHIVTPGETQSTYNMKVFAGGKGLNQSIAIARAGGNVYHAGQIGEDGLFLRELMSESGVNTDYLKVVGGKSGHAIIQVADSGENSIFLYGGANESITKDFVNSVLKDFSSEDMILLQNEIGCLSYIIEKAHEKGMTIAFNPAPFNNSLKTIDFSMISYLVLNEIEGAAFSGKRIPEEIIPYMQENYPDIKTVLTLGKEGCIYADKNTVIRQEAYKVKAVDTTAAGDTFTGFFLAEITAGKSPANAIKTASCASAIVVTKEGAEPSIPFMKDVLSCGFIC